MNGASVKKVILMFFFWHDPVCNSQKFQPSQTPHSHFLLISPRFLTNIRCQYFSLDIWVVYDQLELDWCIIDQNWAKTRSLHFQIFQILNAIDRPIVHCICCIHFKQMHIFQIEHLFRSYCKNCWYCKYFTLLGPVPSCGRQA